MQASVKVINESKGMISVQIDGGDFIVLELLGSDDVDPGDALTGNLESLGSEIFVNVTKQVRLDVLVQNIHCTASSAKKLVGLL